MNLKPLGDRVIIKVLEEEEKTSSGIVLPDKAKEKPQEGKVMAVGPGRILDDGSRVQMDVQVGNKIVFSKYAGTEIKLDGKEYLILRQDDILGVFE